jgi:hypothetical protein
MTGMANIAFTTALVETFRRIQRTDAVFLTVVGSSLLHCARNALVAKALAWGADKVVLLDDDVSWASDDFQKLVLAPEAIVGGVYPKKTGTTHAPTSFAVSALPQGFVPDHRGLVEVHGAATGFLKIDREVFEKIKPITPKIVDASLSKAENEHLFTFFDFPVVQHDGGMRVMGEDYAFCQRARQVGYRIWIDPTIKVRHHVGGFTFDAALPPLNIL